MEDVSNNGRSERRWLRWLLLGLMLAMLCGAAAFLMMPTHCAHGRDPDRANARALEAAAVMYMAEHTSCPSVEHLLRHKIIHAKQRVVDRWGNPLVIVCADGEPWVESAGDDRVRGTIDDFDSRSSQH